MRFVRRLWRRLRRWLSSAPAPRTVIRTDDLPDVLETDRVYLVGEGEHLWEVAFVCPCGCGEMLRMNLMRDARPCWKLVEHEDETASLSPSIARATGCRSHFFLRRGLIEWCMPIDS